MKYLKTFESYVTDLSPTLDEQAVKYLNGEITASQLENYIFKTNEGVVGNTVNAVKDVFLQNITAFVQVFDTFIKKLTTATIDMVNKMIAFGNKIITFVSKFKEKHPTLFKVIIVFITMVIVFIISCSTASAADVDGKTNLPTINAAIGWIDHNGLQQLHQMGVTSDEDKILFDARSYLLDLKDGKIDNPIEASKEAIAFAKSSVIGIQSIIQQAKDTQDTTMLGTILHYAQAGASHVLTTLESTISAVPSIK